MTTSIELQVISKILSDKTSNDELETLLSFDSSYYSVFKKHVQFIQDHYEKYHNVPDVFTFLSEFDDVELVDVGESVAYLSDEIKRNKKHILLVETFNQLKDLGEADVSDAWDYLTVQCEKASELDTSKPMDIVHQGKERIKQVEEFNRQSRIKTGFPEIDKAMYGGFSTVEELCVLVARTNTGKSWVAVKMMEAAQQQGCNVLYYSPEMQSAFIGTRFDTWRTHIQNSQLHRAQYSDEYLKYIDDLEKTSGCAFVLEDKDAPDNEVTVPFLRSFVRKNNIKLLIIDGLSYMTDSRGKRGDSDYIKYKNICDDLFRLSKQCGCAIIVMMQANRETRESKDEKGDVFPNMYNIEGSDHPARIATQVFALRQVFDRHILDIRLEKSRNASNQKPVFSYMWDINTGSMTYIPDPTQMVGTTPVTPVVKPNLPNGTTDVNIYEELSDLYLEDSENVDF